MKTFTETEEQSLSKLMMDMLRPYVPEYKGVVEKEDDSILSIIYLVISRCLEITSNHQSKIGRKLYMIGRKSIL